MLLYRVLSALVGIPVFLYLVWLGGFPLLLFILIITVLGILEADRLWSQMGINIWLPGTIASAVLFVVSTYFINGISFGSVDFDVGYILGTIIFLALITNLLYLIKVYPACTFTDVAVSIFSALYIGWFIGHLLSLRMLPAGFHFVLLVLVATWSTDTFAYFVGMNFGKRRLAPVLSPKKSIEGSVGGVFGSIAACIIIGYLNPQMSMVGYVMAGLLIGIVGQAGDLVESALKRMAGVKDSGNLIPGHGGVLDRFDSLLLTAPLIYYYLRLTIPG